MMSDLVAATPESLGADLHVVLVEPEIHGNTGSSGRTCLAAGAQLHLVEPLGFSLDDARVKRAGLDYWPRVNPLVWPDWELLENKLPEFGEPFFFSSEGTRDYWDVTTGTCCSRRVPFWCSVARVMGCLLEFANRTMPRSCGCLWSIHNYVRLILPTVSRWFCMKCFVSATVP